MRWTSLPFVVLLGCGAEHATEHRESPGEAVPTGAEPELALERESGASPEPTQVEPMPVAGEPGLKLELKVAPELVEALVAIDSPVVPAAQLEALFETLVRDSAPLCRHQHEEGPVTDEEIKAYIHPAGAYRGAQPRTRRSMIAGCWNFVRLNDRRPERDLDLVAALYPAPSYDCTSVGVMQPYLMQQRLGCAHLTMLDFDWQIHRVHAQLLRAMEAGQLGEDLDDKLAAMEVGWIAYRLTRELQPLSLAGLCRTEMVELCGAALRHTQDTLASLEGVTLALAGLHEAPFMAIPPGRVRVVYLSNALERAYTSRDEFQAMMDRLAAVMAPDELTVLIHHAGGERSFGLYELRVAEQGWEVRPRCRDPYAMSVEREGEGDGTYETWLEGVTRDAESVPPCAELLRGLPEPDALPPP